MSESKVTQMVTKNNHTEAESGPVMNDNFVAHMMQIVGSQSYQPTQAQVDKILALEEKGMDYTYRERNTFTADRITKLIILFVFVGIFVFSAYTVPQYLGEILAGMIGFIAGGIGGYGYANTRGATRKMDTE